MVPRRLNAFVPRGEGIFYFLDRWLEFESRMLLKPFGCTNTTKNGSISQCFALEQLYGLATVREFISVDSLVIVGKNYDSAAFS